MRLETSELDRIVAQKRCLKFYGAHVAMSNSNPYFKIKNEATNEDRKGAATERSANAWAEKYRLELQKVAGKETYYVLGRQLQKTKEKKMKKNSALIAAERFWRGCVSNAPKNAGRGAERRQVFFRRGLQDGIRPMSLQGGVVESDACKTGNGAMCATADSMYSKHDYASAANAYNAACVGSQVFPACMKLASMFEKAKA